jgi:hypothetical protein
MVIVESSVKRGKETFLLIIFVRTNLGLSHESRLLSIIIVWHILFCRGKRFGNSSTSVYCIRTSIMCMCGGTRQAPFTLHWRYFKRLHCLRYFYTNSYRKTNTIQCLINLRRQWFNSNRAVLFFILWINSEEFLWTISISTLVCVCMCIYVRVYVWII